MIISDSRGSFESDDGIFWKPLASGMSISSHVRSLQSDKIRAIVETWPCYNRVGHDCEMSYSYLNKTMTNDLTCSCGERMLIISDGYGEVLGVESMKQ